MLKSTSSSISLSTPSNEASAVQRSTSPAKIELKDMASTTGIPETRPPGEHGRREDEPLLGQPGDVVQREEKGMGWNLVMGESKEDEVRGQC